MNFHTPQELIEEIAQGRMVLLVDDEDRENEGDLVLAADFVTPQAINFMAREARGLICLALAPQQIDRLQIPLMVRDDDNYTPNKTAFTISIEASSGVTTGISAADRAHTIKVAANPHAKPGDIHVPGHIFPIRAQQGGVLKRAGHTEGSVDLACLAGLNPAAVICEVMNEDGTMARVSDLQTFAEKHKIKIGSIVDLIKYRLQTESLVEETFYEKIKVGPYQGYLVRAFKSKVDGSEHLVLQKGEISATTPTLVRVHTEAFFRDFFGYLKYGSHPHVQGLEIIEREGAGVALFLLNEKRSHSILTDIQALGAGLGIADHVESKDPPMDVRDYGIGAQILRHLGIRNIRLISNKPEKRVGIKAFGLDIVEFVPFHPTKEFQ